MIFLWYVCCMLLLVCVLGVGAYHKRGFCLV